MKILSWNCQGLGNPWTVKSLRDWCWRERPNVVFLMETMIDSKSLERVRNICGFSEGICLSSAGNSGGIGFWWRDINVSTSSFSSHHFSADICDQDNVAIWRAVGVYGWPEQENKHKTWSLMANITASSELPCLFFGDFNEILSSIEKEGGVVREEKWMDAFRGAVDVCGLRDMGYKGSCFTWKRGKTPETFIRERLDRFLADTEWCNLFPHFSVRHFPIYSSDHAPILLDASNYYERGGNVKAFKFEALWLSSEECGKVVADAWASCVGEQADQRLSRCAERLTSWAADYFGSIKKRKKVVEEQLKIAQARHPDATMFETCSLLSTELDELHRLEESYWHARARANELRDGDRNTAYFHHKASHRRRVNGIKGLLDDNDKWCSSKDELEAIVSNYFSVLFASETPVGFDDAMAGITRVVTCDMNDIFDKEPTAEEIKEALFQMHPNKAPGPDGMHALFFQKFWHILGNDVVVFVKNWWNGSIDLNAVNKTCVVLIPKCENPKRITEFRPISCCNVLYKIISKTMANKLKPFLGNIISVNQSAFVPKRLITDNALVAFEIFHSMKRKAGGREGSVALKLDMKKAYDRVEWSFLEQVMYKMGFGDNWVRRIMDCLSSVSFSFKINGRISGSVIPSRGLRQGDPISPYLFLIVADAFSTLLSKAARENRIHGIKICNGAPKVSHLFFADDSILFAKASVGECSVIADIISKYERASGQSVNLDKTDVVFSKSVNVIRRQEIVTTLGVKEVEKHEKYLGLPTIIGKSKKMVFASLKERIWKKLQGWKEKLLSRPGKEVLIKAVAQAIPTYMMSIFKIPDGFLDEIHALCARFWWGSDGTNRKMHWHSWETMCKPKAMGGMGFRDLKVFNQALLAKQMWRLHNNPGTILHSLLKARYFKNNEVLDARRGFDPSYSWRSMWGAKSLLLDGVRWRVGNGQSILVWRDNWLPGNNATLSPRSSHVPDPDLRVSDLLDPVCGEWDSSLVQQLFEDEVCEQIFKLPLSCSLPSDSLFWWPSKDGEYTVRSGYWLGRMGRLRVELDGMDEDNKDTWRTVWSIGGPPKLGHFLWRACRGSMAVKDVLFRRHIAANDMCGCCGVETESIIHVLFNCTVAKETWRGSPFADLINDAPSSNFAARLLWLRSKVSREELKRIAAIAWAIWYCRNKRVYDNEQTNCPMVAASFVKMVEEHGTYIKNISSYRRPTMPISAMTWSCPPRGMVKINVDAHVTATYAGLGVVVRDEVGKLMLIATKRVNGGLMPDAAEAMAARYGAVIARRFGYTNVWLEGDALAVAKAVDANTKGLSPLFLIYDDIGDIGKQFSAFIISHIRRAGNTVAHLVARWDTRGSTELICMNSFPQSINTLAELDLQ
ncbi:uncharacterized protein [Spinacia oleracea]|uniref:Reverse transcriptase domain-containing protein n=1 Tax=Spinacia oleracea TaxID=3562 RepID=A0A9R0JJR8_SPIOL|nr:uncharacterized protein LOC110776679 [Spinacia oleracea]